MSYEGLFEAVSKRNLTAVKHYVEIDGVDLHLRDQRNDTLAHIAAKNVDLNMLKYLFEKEPDLFETRGYEELKLTQLAVGMNSKTLLKYLLDDCKIDIYREGDAHFPGTCVHWAARLCNLEMFKFFIEERGVDINLNDAFERPLAFSAARGSCIKILEYIIQTGKANLTTTDVLHRNIFCLTAEHCDLTVPKYLLDEKNIDIDLNNTLVIQDAIVYKTRYPSNNLDAFLKYFVEEKGMNVNNGIIDTPLHKAAKAGMLDVVKYLIQHGADVRRKNNSDLTPLEVATDEAVIEYLREQEPLSEKEGNRTRRSLPVALQSGAMIAVGPGRPEVPQLSSSVGYPSGASQVDKPNVDVDPYHFQNILLLAIASIISKPHHVSPPSPRDHVRSRIDPIATDVIYNLHL